MATKGETPGIEYTVRKVLEEVPGVPNPRREDVKLAMESFPGHLVSSYPQKNCGPETLSDLLKIKGIQDSSAMERNELLIHESQNSCAECKKPNQKEFLLYGST